MKGTIRFALFLVAIATVFAGWCLYETTALSMTAFFSLSVPAYGLAALLYVVEVLRDLREHRVL